MAHSIDPPRPPLAPVARLLAEAAQQRQSALLGAAGGPAAAAPAGASVDAPGHLPGAQPLPPTAPAASPAPATQGERLSLSEQARQGLQGLQTAPGRAAAQAAQAALLPAAAAGAPRTQAPAAAQGQAPASSTGGAPGRAAVAATVAAQWPAQGVSAPLLRLLNTLVQQVAAPTGPAPRVLAAQPWPPGLGLPGVEAGAAGGGAPALPALQIWRVAQGSLHTPEGTRGFTLTLRLPQPAGMAAALMPALPSAAPVALSAGFAGPLQALAPGLFALVLQGPGAAGQRSSALLSLELAPAPGAAAVVYGRDPLQARADPWLAMAALQASGQWRAEEEDDAHRRGASLCRTPGCPYEDRAPCAQPFCLALRVQPAPPAPPTAPAAPA